MGYEYEAFFSYRRDKESDEWHHKVKEKIRFWLMKELGDKNVEIFFDSEQIKTGDRWQEKIADGLKRSKCFIGIWSPDYFKSRWCLSEWRSFIEREKKFKKRKSLIVPARYHDGSCFPTEALDFELADFRDYTSTMTFFWNTEDGYLFEKERLKEFAKNLAGKIRKAPEYSDEFPILIVDEGDVADQSTIGRVADTA